MIIGKKILTISFLLSSYLYAANTSYPDYRVMLNNETVDIRALDSKLRLASSNKDINNLDVLDNFKKTSETFNDWTYTCTQDLGCEFQKGAEYGSNLNNLNNTLVGVENSTNVEVGKINEKQSKYTSSKVAMYNGGVRDFLVSQTLMSGIHPQTDTIDDKSKLDFLIQENGFYGAPFKVLTEDSDIILYERMGDALELEFSNEYTNNINREKITLKKKELEYYRSQYELLKKSALEKKANYEAMPDTVFATIKTSIPVSKTETVGTTVQTDRKVSVYDVLSDVTTTNGETNEVSLTDNGDGTGYDVTKSCTTDTSVADTAVETCNYNKSVYNTTVEPIEYLSTEVIGSSERTIKKGYTDSNTSDINNTGVVTESRATTTTDSRGITTTTTITKNCTTTENTTGEYPGTIIKDTVTTCEFVKQTNANGSYTEYYITNEAKINGLKEVNDYIEAIDKSIDNLNKDSAILDNNFNKISKASQEELYLRKLIDVAQQFQLSLFLSLAYEDYAARNDILYDKDLTYQIYSQNCKEEQPEVSPTNSSVTLTNDIIESFNELCTIYKQAEGLSFVMNDLKKRLQLALESYLLGEYDMGIFDAMFLPPTDEVGLDLPLVSKNVQEMYADNFKFVKKFTDKVVLDMAIINQNYPLDYQLKNRDLYLELEAFANNGKSIALDSFIKSINNVKTNFEDCDYTGCITSTVTNIERIFMSNNYLLSKESLTEIEKANNLQFIGNLLKMNRVIKEAEAVLQVDPSNAYAQISNVSSVFQSVFPVNQKYLTVADYKIAYKLKNSAGSDNKNEGRDTYERIIEHINSGDRPVTGGEGELYKPEDGGANGGSNPNPNDGKDNGNIPGIGDTGGIDLGSPYEGNYGYSPEWTDYSKEWDGRLFILDDYIRKLYNDELRLSGYKDYSIETKNILGSNISMLYDYREKGRTNILHNDNRVLKDKIKFEFSNESNFIKGTTSPSKVIKGLNDKGVVTPELSNNFNRAGIPLNGSISPLISVKSGKEGRKTISPTAKTLYSGAKCVGINSSCTKTTEVLPHTLNKNWGKE